MRSMKEMVASKVIWQEVVRLWIPKKWNPHPQPPYRPEGGLIGNTCAGEIVPKLGLQADGIVADFGVGFWRFSWNLWIRLGPHQLIKLFQCKRNWFAILFAGFYWFQGFKIDDLQHWFGCSRSSFVRSVDVLHHFPKLRNWANFGIRQ